MQKCALDVARMDDYDSRQAMINTGDQSSVDLYLTIKPEEYTAAILCKRPDILMNFQLARRLMASGRNVDPTLKGIVNSVLAQLSASIGVNPLDLDLDNLSCSEERICEVRGSVPIEVLTDVVSFYKAIPSRQVRVLAGNCEDKVGYVNERFIDF